MQTNMSENATSNAQASSGDIQDDDEISLLDLLQVVVDNLRLLVLGPLVCGLAALGISFAITPTFTAKTQFLPPQQQQSAAASLLASLGSLGGLAGAASGIKSPSDQYIAFMKSLSVHDALIERFKLKEKYQSKLKADARLSLTGNVRIVSGKDGLISVEVDDKDPKFAADLANAHVDELRNLLGRLAVTEAQQRRMFFEKQLQVTKESLAKADMALKSSGISGSVLKSSPSSAVESVARLKAGISVQEVKLGSMRNYLTENSPEFKQAMNELGSLKIQLSKAEKDEPVNSSASDYVTKYRDFKYQETMFELFVRQFELAKLDESREGAVIQVLDVAEPPEKSAKPQKGLIAILVTLASGFFLLIFVFIVSLMNKNLLDIDAKLRLAMIKASWLRAFGKVDKYKS
jgi:tyrosine-protein kinase Etk/Wzc